MVLKKIDLFTNEVEIINIIAINYSINEIFTENKDILKKVKNLKIKVSLVRSYQDLKKKKFFNSELGISYGFGIIFKKKL